ncbi:MAG: ABC transporter ATP-binding protein [Spirosomataceae bacterium]
MIHFQDVNFGYRKGQPLFENMSFDLPAGRIYGLLGLNGAGKTSLLKLMAGLVFPEQGLIQVLGHEPKQRSIPFLSSIYFVDDESWFPKIHIPVFVKINIPFYPDFQEELFYELLKTFNISPEKRLDEYSLGQRKKIHLAFGMATQPRLLLLDEPTNGLDIPSKEQLRQAIATFISPEQSIIIATHHVQEVEALIDYLIVLHQHKVVFSMPTEDITSHFRFVESGTLQEGALYHEESLRGQLSILPNPLQLDSQLHIEPLFKGIIAAPDSFQIHEFVS